MKIAIILGTRPEIIKLSPIIRECERRKLDYCIVHTGQHYSYEMDRIFFDELKLPLPGYHLDVGSGSHGRQTGKMLAGIEDILAKEAPDMVYVQGDTNTVLAGALAAAKLHIRIGHVEAGLRSFDRSMPEEVNRVMTDHVSDLLFAPTAASKELLLKEGIPENRIFVTGNTIVDAVRENLRLAGKKLLQNLGLSPKSYLLSTLHRQENVDDRARLTEIFKGLGLVSGECGLPVVLPVHPRTRKMIEAFGLKIPENIRLAEPVGFLEFLEAESNARLVLTDSGGVQEECCILGVPCVTLRENTERPETVQAGANVIAGYRSDTHPAVGAENAGRGQPVAQPVRRRHGRPADHRPVGRRDAGMKIHNHRGQSKRNTETWKKVVIMKVCVIGLGYIGLPTALLLSQKNDVIGVDLKKDVVEKINDKIMPFEEPGLEDLLKRSGMVASTDGTAGGRFHHMRAHALRQGSAHGRPELREVRGRVHRALPGERQPRRGGIDRIPRRLRESRRPYPREVGAEG